jgi:uncharacterized membrane protein
MTWENSIFSSFTFSSGLMYLLLGIYGLKFPPPKINAIYGYKTKRSMLSQERWDFAQNYSAKECIRWSLVLILISIAGLSLYNMDLMMAGVFAAMILNITLLIIVFIRTERALRTRFGERTL